MPPSFAVLLRIALAAFALSGALLPGDAAATGVGIQPANIELVVQPGSTVRRVVKVGNLRTDRAQRFVVGIAEWRLDDNGLLKMQPPGAGSVASWVRFTPAQFTLGPGEGQNVLVEIGVPARVPEAEEKRFALLVTNPPPPPGSFAGKQGIHNRFQVSTLFYVTMDGLAPRPTVESAEWDAADAARPAVRARIANPGTAHARFIAVTEIADAEGRVVHKSETATVLMDGQSREWVTPFKLDALAPGRYGVTWNAYSTFDPKRPDQRAGELLESREWTWDRPVPQPKPAAR